MLHTLYNYCKKNIEGFRTLEKRALKKMDQYREPLSFACPELFEEMSERVFDYCEDNEIENDFDIEEVFWEGGNE